MIRFDRVSKRFPDGTLAVDDLSLDVGAGEAVVLVGPSGCGKTTIMRMVNRLTELSSGRVLVDGDDVTTADPATLRRRIGYVIQQVGLFPHRTVAQNIATVPQLLDWDRVRIERRVDELLALVGLPVEIAQRYPHQLSGGQQQRIGVARALAADPPILLMDEPFGAVDPLVRARLQEEFLAIQRQMRKTVLFVTHDIDEAILVGDRIALLSAGGHVEQLATPAELLAEPANEFVVNFLGPERGLKRLALIPVSEAKADPGPLVRPGEPASRVRDVAAAAGTDWVVVVDGDGILLGWLWVHEVAATVPGGPARAFNLTLAATDSLRRALDAMVTSRTGVAVRVSAGQRYEGILTQEILSREIL